MGTVVDLSDVREVRGEIREIERRLASEEISDTEYEELTDRMNKLALIAYTHDCA